MILTGKAVEDIFKEVIANLVFEHPVHSCILDQSDLLWTKDMSEIKS